MIPRDGQVLGATRYVPRGVIRRLLEEARGRCSLHRELLIPGERRIKKLAKLLNKHHVIYFSSGGPNTEGNLILVCPNCHALIHAHPDIYTPELLRASKEHWTAMRGVVSTELEYPDTIGGEDLQRVPIVLETVNLRFEITVPKQLPVGQLAQFVRHQIVSPLGKYDNNPAWRNPESVAIVLASRPRTFLDPMTSIVDVHLREGDALGVLVHTWSQAVRGPRFVLRAEPVTPQEGQNYVVTVETDPSSMVTIEVNGTDGYHNESTGRANAEGSYAIGVPGARSGTVDTIRAQGLARTSITLVFLPRRSMAASTEV